MDMDVSHKEIRPFARSPPHVLHMTLLIRPHVVRVQQDGRVVISKWLALKRCDSRRGKYFLGGAVDRHDFRVRLSHFIAEIVLRTDAGYRNISANQKALASFQLVRAYGVAVIRYSHYFFLPKCFRSTVSTCFEYLLGSEPRRASVKASAINSSGFVPA